MTLRCMILDTCGPFHLERTPFRSQLSLLKMLSIPNAHRTAWEDAAFTGKSIGGFYWNAVTPIFILSMSASTYKGRVGVTETTWPVT